MRSKVGSNSTWMIRPTLHRRKVRRCEPADASLGRSRPTRSHLTQVSHAADVAAVSSSERNSKTNSNGRIVIGDQPTMSAKLKTEADFPRRGKTSDHRNCKKKSTGAAQARTAEVEFSSLRKVPSSTSSDSRPAGSALMSAAASLGAGKSLARAAAVGCRKTLCTGRVTWKGSGVYSAM